jgi:1,4-dihydroxy-2-naphthoate octaprenyltransferase
MFVRDSVLSEFGLGEMFGFCFSGVICFAISDMFQKSSGKVTVSLADVHFAIGSGELVSAGFCVELFALYWA